MSHPRSVSRVAATGALVVVVLATSACGWLRRENALYAQSPESRPLEVPPDLDRPRMEGAVGLPDSTQSVTRSQVGAAPASASAGFVVPASRDEVFAQVGQLLAATSGVTVINSAALLGSYDVNYDDSNFLIRISAAEGGSQITAVDPRGLPAEGPAVTALMSILRSQLGG